MPASRDRSGWFRCRPRGSPPGPGFPAAVRSAAHLPVRRWCAASRLRGVRVLLARTAGNRPGGGSSTRNAAAAVFGRGPVRRRAARPLAAPRGAAVGQRRTHRASGPARPAGGWRLGRCLVLCHGSGHPVGQPVLPRRPGGVAAARSARARAGYGQRRVADVRHRRCVAGRWRGVPRTGDVVDGHPGVRLRGRLLPRGGAARGAHPVAVARAGPPDRGELPPCGARRATRPRVGRTASA